MNPNATGRDARILVYYSGQPDLQYGRDVWLPGRSLLTTWMLIGPAPKGDPRGRELQILLYDRTSGQERFALRAGQERLRSRLLPYAPSRTLTSILMDLLPPTQGEDIAFRLDPEGEDILQMARLFRANCDLSPHLGVVQDNFLLPTDDAFDGVDHFILASSRLAQDPPGLAALRHWLEHGGKLWVMLDLVGADAVTRLLGDDPGFQIVDRTSLTTIRIEGHEGARGGEEPLTQEFEQPVNFVRVILSPKYRVLGRVNGWPALCVRPVGRGKLVMSTLGARAWFRERAANDPKSPFPEFPILPMPLPAMEPLTKELGPSSDSQPVLRDVFRPLLTDEIGYSIVGLGTVALIFGSFLVVLLVIGIVLWNAGRSEQLVWIAPAAAVAAAGIFLILGEVSRRNLPPTVAVVQMVHVNPRAEEQPVTGMFAIFRPDAGTLPLRSEQGGLLDFDMSGSEGQTRQFIMTDLDAWHWENLTLPAGMREGSFRYSLRTGKAVTAVATFGPEGVKGRLTAGPFQGLTDALIRCPNQRHVLGESAALELSQPLALAVPLGSDNTFQVGEGNLLAPGQFLSDTVLTDRQQHRQDVYRKLLIEKRGSDNQSILMAWAEPAEMPFNFETGIRTAGSALLAIPLDFEPTPPDTKVTVPRAFVAPRRMIQGVANLPSMEGQYGVEQHIRFQIPSSVLPMKVERARLFAKLNAPLRTFSISGRGGAGPVQLQSWESPIDTIQFDIVREDLLRLDEQGGLHLDIGIGEEPKSEAANPRKWSIEFLELEVVGRTLPGK